MFCFLDRSWTLVPQETARKQRSGPSPPRDLPAEPQSALSPPPLRALRPLSPPFTPHSEFFSQSHFLLLWLFLAQQIRDTGVISGTFEVPINNGPAWPAPEPSASSSDQRLASCRPRPWNKAPYWIPEAAAPSPPSLPRQTPGLKTFTRSPSSCLLSQDPQESPSAAHFLISSTLAGNQQA